MSYSGSSKIEFCRRLGKEDWKDLADYLRIPPSDQDRFKQGDEGRGIWEWLQQRTRLQELPTALEEIHRADLANTLEEQERIGFENYFLERTKYWSTERFALDRHFVQLTLLLDQGEDSQGPRWAPQPIKFQDLRQVLSAMPEHRALVLLGPPGSGKSTLLGHVELDCAQEALNRDEVPLTFFLPLNLYRPDAKGDKLPAPRTWLEERWASMHPKLPPLDTLLHDADSDPLPPLPSTGWEETTVLAAAMVENPDAYVATLMEANLPLAGRCAAQPDVAIAEALRAELQQALIGRTQNPKADLRARIAAGLALGELGDPRFERCRGLEGDEYLLPPLVAIAAGTYTIGSDEGHYDDESPVHTVEVAAFQMGQFPVTNAEWALFMKAGGYEDERWWETAAAKAWRRGEGTAEGPKRQWRENRQYFQAHFDAIRGWQQAGRITSKQADDWEQIARMSDDEFESQLDDWYPSGRQTQPRFWDDDVYNNPAQPAVGISWFEARAYCAWLSAQTGRPFRLPTEAEWEAAARGRAARRYAYGNDFDLASGNTFETHIRRTTPIDVFPGGETPEGLVDMTGNSWDWTSSLYQPYPYDANDGREAPEAEDGRRVVRGGGWRGGRLLARAACLPASTASPVVATTPWVGGF